MVMMDPVEANFLLVQVDESTFDVVIFAEEEVLRAFQEVYKAHYIPDSIFENQTVAIIPDFPNQHHAETWKQYWIQAFAEPENACKTCETVNALFERIEEGRNET